MTIATLVLSIIAVVIALLALGYNRRSARAAEKSAGASVRSAEASERAAAASETSAQAAWVSSGAATESAGAATAADHRADTPVLSPHLDSGYTDPLILQIRNDGRQDLHSVRVDQYVDPGNGVVHPVARTGERGGPGTAFTEQVEIGPIRIGERSRVTLSLGPKPWPRGVRLRVTASDGSREWSLSVEVPNPPSRSRVVALGGP